MLKPEEMINNERIQLNLILSSLYLSAFEVLKAAIIDSVAFSFVFLTKPDEDFILSLKEHLSEDDFSELYKANIGWYQEQVNEYSQEVGGDYERRNWLGLIPSCKWLQKEGVITQQDVDIVRKLREQRNSIAHELPKLVVDTGFAVDIDSLGQITRILKKVGTYLARIDADIPGHVPDEDIISGREIVLGIIWDSVVKYLDSQIKSE